jgi:hypothetical protein
MTDAYSWIMKNGINSEKDYPYVRRTKIHSVPFDSFCTS